MGIFNNAAEADLNRWVNARLGEYLPLRVVKKELRELPEILGPGEQPELISTATCQSIHTVLVVLTDRRLILRERGILGVNESIDLAEIKAAVLEKGRLGMVLRFAYGADVTWKLSGVDAAHAEQLMEAIRTRSGVLSEEAGRSSTDWSLDQLLKLGQLRDAGVLSEAEFEAQKAKILQSMS